ncbi:MAG: hypothetical protein U1A72_06445, partial [Sulfuritalea sp.]|nr:hypothetical protein [Sulfuritalea sp.]
GAVDMWIARLTATSPHTHSPAKSQPFLNLDFNVKTDRSDSNLDWNGLPDTLLSGHERASRPF